MPVSSFLTELRTEFPDLAVQDEVLLDEIVTGATGYGLAVHFDGKTEEA